MQFLAWDGGQLFEQRPIVSPEVAVGSIRDGRETWFTGQVRDLLRFAMRLARHVLATRKKTQVRHSLSMYGSGLRSECKSARETCRTSIPLTGMRRDSGGQATIDVLDDYPCVNRSTATVRYVPFFVWPNRVLMAFCIRI